MIIHNRNGTPIAEVEQDEYRIANVQDSLDLIANADYQGARAVVIDAQHIVPEFFDLRTRLAGDVLQKVSNYRMRLAITGDWSEVTSNSLAAFIRECNRGNTVYFASDLDAALDALAR